ncbi:MAG: type II secretion system protein [Blastocatellia bacterium]
MNKIKRLVINDKGYSLFEITIVILIISFAIVGIAINIPAATSTVAPETALVQTASAVLTAKRNALLGVSAENERTFQLAQTVNTVQGVSITATPVSFGKQTCSLQNCFGQFGPTPFDKETESRPTKEASSSICVSGQSFCFDNSNSFTFNTFSGRTSSDHAIFFSNNKRNLALLVTKTGDLLIAELLNNEWKSRTDLQELILKDDSKPSKEPR